MIKIQRLSLCDILPANEVDSYAEIVAAHKTMLDSLSSQKAGLDVRDIESKQLPNQNIKGGNDDSSSNFQIPFFGKKAVNGQDQKDEEDANPEGQNRSETSSIVPSVSIGQSEGLPNQSQNAWQLP